MIRMKTNSGLALVEVLVAGGILAGLAVVSMKMMEMQTRSNVTAENRSELIQTFNEITYYLLNKKACSQTFSALGDVEINNELVEIKNQFGVTKFNKTDLIGNKRLKIKSMTIENVEISESPLPSGNRSGILSLAITFENISKFSLGGNSVRKIPIKIAVNDSNEVVDCYSATDSAVDTARVKACSDLGGIFNTESEICEGIRVTFGQFDSSIPCDEEREGSIRYEKAKGILLLCQNGDWTKTCGKRIDGHWSEESFELNACTCGGVSISYLKCNNPTPRCGGTYCRGSPIEVTICGSCAPPPLAEIADVPLAPTSIPDVSIADVPIAPTPTIICPAVPPCGVDCHSQLVGIGSTKHLECFPP